MADAAPAEPVSHGYAPALRLPRRHWQLQRLTLPFVLALCAVLGLDRHARQRLQDETPHPVTLDIESGLTVQADPGMCRELLWQLLSNAWKFTRSRDDARISICRVGNESPALFCVRDNGIGFDMAFGHKLFRVFSRLHTPGKDDGIGMGLAVVQTIVDRHGGRVWAEAEEGSGAAFYFSLEPQVNHSESSKTAT